LDGDYIVSGNVVDIHDRFRIRITDLSSNSYDRYFEVIDIIPSISKGEGSLLTLDCLGIEYHTQMITMSSPYWFEDAFTVVNDIAGLYNAHKGDDQPFVDNTDVVWDVGGNGIGNDAPFFTANNYEYGESEDKCYNRWMDVLEKLGASVSAGGTLTFFELSFKSTGVNALDMRFRTSGDNTSLVTLKNAQVIPNFKVTGEQEGVLSNPTGSHVVAWGSDVHGSLPYEYSKYISEVEFFEFRPDWQTGVDYKIDAKIRVVDPLGNDANHIQHYKALTDHTSGASSKPEDISWATDWVEIELPV